MTHVQQIEQEYQRKMQAAKAKDAAAFAVDAVFAKYKLQATIVYQKPFGNGIVIGFGDPEEDRPFSFGREKAERMCRFVDQYGEKALLELLRAAAGRK